MSHRNYSKEVRPCVIEGCRNPCGFNDEGYCRAHWDRKRRLEREEARRAVLASVDGDVEVDRG